MEKTPRFRRMAAMACIAERLEDRLLLTALVSNTAPGNSAGLAPLFATPTFIDLGPVANKPNADASPNTLSPPFTPSEIDDAYGVNQISFGATVGNGAGQTIAIVDAYNDPDIISDANSFSSAFDLPQFNSAGNPTLTVLNQTGGTSPPTNSSPGGWDVEESLDVEWVHSIAPDANIILFEADSNSDSDLYAAVQEAADYPGVSVVSMSWGGSEYSGETSEDSIFTTPTGHSNVTFLASTGDTGGELEYPAVSPNVVAVGGTSLTINSNGSYGGETAWAGGGGGISADESLPSFQVGKINGDSSTNRTVPDVSMEADPNTGVDVLDSYDYTGGYLEVGGTSLSVQLWAGLIGIADQGRALGSLSPLSSATAHTALYDLSPSYFHDVTSGSNGNPATVGYDLATGIGTPIANLLVPALAGYQTGPMLAFAQQPPSTVTAGVTITPNIIVDIENANGTINTSGNSNVTLSVYAGPDGPGATISGTATVMAVSGVAKFTNVSLDLAGPYTLEATDGTLYSALSNNFNVVATTATKLAFVQQPSTTSQGAAITPPVTVAVEDQYGNVATTNTSTVTVALGMNTNGATLSGTLSESAVNGVASFGNLSVNNSGTFTLTASDGSLTGATSSSFLVGGKPAKLVFAQEPTGTGIGAAISPAVTVDVEDSNGNLVTSDSSTVTLSIAGGPLGGTMGGVVSVAADDGVATFNDIWFSLGGGYTLTATDGSLTKPFSTAFTITGSYSMSFSPFNARNGEYPLSSPVLDSSGNLWGTTQGGGVYGEGTIYEVAKGSSTIKTVVSFDGTDGAYPWSGLTFDSSGDIFGVTGGGGPDGDGTVFEILKGTSTVNTLASFNGSNGNFPRGPVVLDSSGDLFGAAYQGGADSDGCVFEVVKGSGAITVLASFTGANGEDPTGGVVIDGSGNLFGTAYYGGADGYGDIWELVDGSGTIMPLASFTGLDSGEDGGYPGSLVRDSSGDLYGTTGGAYGNVFELPSGSGTIDILATFPNENTYPGPLILDANGDLIGVTAPAIATGSTQCGTVFEIAPGSGAITTLASLSGTNGCWGTGVAMDSSGNIYGVAEVGGTTSFSTNSLGDGVVFELAAPHLIFYQQPGNSAAGAAISPAIYVEIENVFGSTITNDTSNIKLSIASGPSSMLGGTVSEPLNSALASFNNVSIGTAGTYTLSANYTPNGNVNTVSASFNITAAVAGEYLFYYGSSAFDGSATSPSPADLNAVATDKTALVSGSTATTATFSNISSYSDGLNGILIDFADLPSGVTFSASDFAFKVGNNSNSSSWSTAPAPTAVATWTSGGGTYADIVWANNAIQEEWLQVTVKADANTQLANSVVFYFGSEIGATGVSTATTSNGPVLRVTSADVVNTENNASLLKTVPITNIYDFNRDGKVTSTDVVLCQNNATLLGGIVLITVGGSTGNVVLGGSSSASDSIAAETLVTSSDPNLLSTVSPKKAATARDYLQHN